MLTKGRISIPSTALYNRPIFFRPLSEFFSTIRNLAKREFSQFPGPCKQAYLKYVPCFRAASLRAVYKSVLLRSNGRAPSHGNISVRTRPTPFVGLFGKINMAYRSAWQRDCLSDRRSGFLSDEEIRKFPTNLWYSQSGGFRFGQRVTKAKVFRLKH